MTRRLPPSWTDWGIPLLLLVLAWAELFAFRPERTGLAAACYAVSCALLVPRRRWPMVTPPLAGVATLSMPWFGPQLDELAVPILLLAVCLYTAARWVPGLRGLLVMVVLGAALFGDYFFTDDRDNNVTDLFFAASLFVPPYVFGRVARKLAVQAAQLERQQELVRREAAREERDRIARELHDVIAHSVSAMVVQTAAAQDLVRLDPERAERVLADVAATGRQALSETGQLLHVLRDTDDELGLAPVPGLAQVPALVERFRQDGLDVRSEIDIPLDGLPAAVDVSAYRLVQEALTNALRYAPDRAVELSIAAAPTRLSIRTSNLAGSAHAAPTRGSGLGLLGLAERVSLLGGSLTHGLTPAGRFELRADLPIGPAA